MLRGVKVRWASMKTSRTTTSQVRDLSASGLPRAETQDLAFWIGLVIAVLSLISGLTTFLILTGLTPVVPRHNVVVYVLLLNVALIIAMIGVIAWQFWGLWLGWKNKDAGVRLHIRIVALFSIIAALPALLLATAATTTFARAVDNVFSQRTRQIIEDSRNVARAYLIEHGQVIRTETVNMVKDLERNAAEYKRDIGNFSNMVLVQAGLRDLTVAYILSRNGIPLIKSLDDNRLPFVKPSAAKMKAAARGQIPVLLPNRSYRIAAIAKLPGDNDAFLYVARHVSPRVVNQLKRTEAGVIAYEQFRSRRSGFKLVHGLLYLMISLTSLLAAVWVGIWFAGRFVAPITRLIGAAQEVSKGNLKVVLPVIRGEGDLRRLSETFNTMTSELKGQRDALVAVNEQLIDRRAFMEAVLSGVSAGVLGLDIHGNITIANNSAQTLLAKNEPELLGKHISDVAPEFSALLDTYHAEDQRQRTPAQLSLQIGTEERTFAVTMTSREAQPGDDSQQGTVITFDDITELVVAQRTSAWADVARRIAHEIKNPLTPIQLSAERLKRKYATHIESDRETFDKLTDTIVRQVGDIKTMVDEFAAYARMPQPEMSPHDLRDAVQEPILLFRESESDIDFALDLPDHAVTTLFDRRLLTQALTNLVKNAAEAVNSYAESDSCEPGFRGRVIARLSVDDDTAIIDVIDNGTGLPKQNRNRLLEPYVTTKGHKGTGLGLAMVHKIMEQHGGALSLDDAPLTETSTHGARLRLTLPMVEQASDRSTAELTSQPG